MLYNYSMNENKQTVKEILQKKIQSCNIEPSEEFTHYLIKVQLTEIEDEMIFRAFGKYCGQLRQKTESPKARLIDTDTKGEA